jgi:uncharacterized iron-regulated protein
MIRGTSTPAPMTRPRNGAALVAGLAAATLISAPPTLAGAPCVPVGEWRQPGHAARVDPLKVAAAGGGVVLLGELHSSAEHHRWQLHSLVALHTLHPELVIGLEMVPRRLQPVLDRWVAGELAEAAFLEAVQWQSVWGYDPALYLPILHFARMHRLPLLALNVDPGLPRRVRAEGLAAIPVQAREGVGPPAAASPAYRTRLRTAWQAHGSANPTDTAAFERFVDSQLLWDRAMAEGIANQRRRQPQGLVVALMGSGHLVFGDGVPHQLQALGVDQVRWFLPWDQGQDCANLKPGLASAVFGLAAPARAAAPMAAPVLAPPGTRLGIQLEDKGGTVRILRVATDSLAAANDLQGGDQILAIDGTPVRSAQEVIAQVRRQPPQRPLRLTLQRQGQRLERVIRFARR